MISENIKELRKQANMTQKDLADKLFITPQAVSRWENGEVEPSVSFVAEMAKIFQVPGDRILGISDFSKTETVIKTEYVVKEPEKPVLAVCETCNKPIYDAHDIVRHNNDGINHASKSVFCRACEEKRLAREKEYILQTARGNRTKSFIWSSLAALVCCIIGIIFLTGKTPILSILFFGAGVLAFTYISCLLLDNNFIFDLTVSITSWGFVTMPGVIFTLDLDGIIWLLTVKLAMWIISYTISVAVSILAVCLGAVISLFVYPFALYNNIKHPELLS